MALTQAKLDGSFRTELQMGRHRIVADEPTSAGGTDQGPTPYELLAGALAGCTAMTLHFYAKRENYPLTGVDLTVSQERSHAKDCADCLSKSGFIHRFEVKIQLKGNLSEQQRAKLLDVARRCPVAKTLMSEIKIQEALV